MEEAGAFEAARSIAWHSCASMYTACPKQGALEDSWKVLVFELVYNDGATTSTRAGTFSATEFLGVSSGIPGALQRPTFNDRPCSQLLTTSGPCGRLHPSLSSSRKRMESTKYVGLSKSKTHVSQPTCSIDVWALSTSWCKRPRQRADLPRAYSTTVLR